MRDEEELARKVDPRYTRGALVRVATGRQQPEAEMIQGMLLEEGIPSTVKRSIGFDVPDMLAAGPRDIYVAASAADVAREVLLQSELLDPENTRPIVRSGTLLVWLLIAVAVVALILWLGSDLS